MRKLNKGRMLSRPKSQRKALLRTLATSLFLHEKIKTTKAKKNNLFSRRILSRDLAIITVKKLVDEIAPRYQERHGGYTRIIKLGPRHSDGAKMVIIELVK